MVTFMFPLFWSGGVFQSPEAGIVESQYQLKEY